MNDIGIDWGRLAAAFGLLFGFGCAYNGFVGWLERHGYDEGYTWAMVVMGTAVTLGGMALVDWQGAVLALVCFAGSGLPMMAGSWWRYVQRRRAGQDALRGDD